jgi:hypothetical protein
VAHFPREAESSSAPPRELKNSNFYLYSEQQKKRLSLNWVALRETKLQVDDDDDDDDDYDDDGNDR